ncbi:hypothetical protein [Gordonia sp. (in: high G+C Gram-positive bacteria)]|uniref:hypothetical protein n=1 Tax=Gordonia sp. (in: high G+C Gram-positive bacteria) TaxID=84139 RepID=UPI003C710005
MTAIPAIMRLLASLTCVIVSILALWVLPVTAGAWVAIGGAIVAVLLWIAAAAVQKAQKSKDATASAIAPQ